MTDISNQELLDALVRQLDAITDSMVTKKDLDERLDERLQAFATREYLDERLEAFATKEYLDERLKACATKEDLKDLATKADIIRLERKIEGNQRANIQHHLAVREGIGDLNSQLTHLREGLAGAAGPI
jgi:hypothetical protein